MQLSFGFVQSLVLTLLRFVGNLSATLSQCLEFSFPQLEFWSTHMEMLLHISLLLLCLFSGVKSTDSTGGASAQWSGWGGDFYNDRWASQNKAISTSNINSISSHCNISYLGGVSATPVVSGNTVYYPTWNGSFAALDYNACKLVWQINVTDLISQYAPISPFQQQSLRPVSRSSPQIDGNVVYFGTLTHALVFAVNRFTGRTLGSIQINAHPVAQLTMSPTFYDGKLFIGSSSSEELAALQPGYVCCSFVGNMAALSFDGSNFKVVWNISMIPDFQVSSGWSGLSVWGSQPSIDRGRGQVFVATGNTYSIPEVIIDCQNRTQNITAVEDGLVPDPCLPRNIWQNSVLAIDIELGIINWVQQIGSLDAWTLACGLAGQSPRNPGACPQTPGEDVDFGMAPTFVPGSPYTPYGKDTLVIGQKSGNLYAMSAQSGYFFWSTAASPDGIAGGSSWGIAVDDNQVYFTAINSNYANWQLLPLNQTINRSAYGAASLATHNLGICNSPRQRCL
jgi:outer membrane protein assembly factor BamB